MRKSSLLENDYDSFFWILALILENILIENIYGHYKISYLKYKYETCNLRYVLGLVIKLMGHYYFAIFWIDSMNLSRNHMFINLYTYKAEQTLKINLTRIHDAHYFYIEKRNKLTQFMKAQIPRFEFYLFVQLLTFLSLRICLLNYRMQ